MPVTKTAKRALRGSKRKAQVNSTILANLEKAIRAAKKSKSLATISKASALADRAAKKHTVHVNRASRIKSALAKLAKPAASKSKVSKKKTSKKK